MKYIIILLFISICLNILLCSNDFRYYLEDIGSKKKLVPKNYIQTKKERYTHFVLKKMLKKFIKIADEHNIKYWITAGTLLGAIRHENIVPWDDDIDLGVTKESLEKIKQIKEEFDKEGIIISYDDVTLTQIRFKENNIHIDLFEYKIDKDKYIITNKSRRHSYSKEYFFIDEIEKLKEGKLDDMIVKIPSESFRFLREVYGEWEIPISYGEHGDTAIKKSDYKDFI